MAVDAKFVADFSSFTAAVEKAQVSLKNVEADANEVGASLNRMTDNFSGRKLINEALLMTKAVESVGGASALTASEMVKVNSTVTEAIAKYAALGKTAPPAMVDLANATKQTESATTHLSQATKVADTSTGSWSSSLSKVNGLLGAFGISLGLGALVSFGRELLRTGDELVKVSDKTGLTIAEVQKLQYIAGQSGSSFESLSDAVNKVQRSLVEGDKGAVGAVKLLGLNLGQLRDAAPFEVMSQISESFRKIENPAIQAEVAFRLFGKAGGEVIPALLSQFQELGDAAPKMSDETAHALDQAGDALTDFWQVVKVKGAEAVNEFVKETKQLISETNTLVAHMLRNTATLLDMLPGYQKAFAVLGITTDDLIQKADQLEQRGEAQRKSMDDTGEAMKKTGRATSEYAALLKRLTDQHGGLKSKIEETTLGINTFVGPLQEALKSTDTWGMGIGQLNSRLVTVTGTMAELRGELEPLASTTIPQMSGGLAALGAEFTGPLPDGIEKTVKKVGALQSAFDAVETVLGGVQTKFAQMAVVAVRTAETMISAFKKGDWVGFIAAGVAGAIQLIGGLFKSAESKINATRKAFVDAAGGLDMLRDKATAAGVTINELLNAKNAKQYEEAIRKLNQAFEEHQADIDLAKELIDEYGLSVEQLGPKWKAQQLSEQSDTLLNKLRVMVDVLGLSMPDALVVMAGKFNEAFQTALRFGIELPEQMKPVLEKLVEMGQLIDENGEVVTDLQATGITFSESFGKSVDRLIAKFDEWLQKIGLIPAAIDNIPKDFTVTGHINMPDVPDVGGATGGLVTSSGIQSFAGGGRVLAFRPRGTDTVPAMLTPGEGVLTVAEMRALGGVSGFQSLRASLRGGGGSSDLASELRGLRAELRADRVNGPQKIARAVRDEVQKARVGRR